MTSPRGREAFPVHGIRPSASVGSLGTLFAVEDVREAGSYSMNDIPHRHDFTELLYLSAGSGHHVVDFEPYPIAAPQVSVLAQGQVHHWEGSSGVHGDLVLFHDEFLAPGGDAPPEVAELVALGATALTPDPDQARRVERLLAAARDECATGASRPAVLRGLLTALLIEACGMSSKVAPAGSSLSRDFTRVATRNVSALMSVGDCAERLGVTPGHLYDVVLSDTGRAPGELIRGALTREAQRLLLGSELTAAQIAARLEFSSSSYFSRFFRRETGVTPSRYREDARSRGRLTVTP